MKTFKIVFFAVLVAVIASLVGQWSGLDQMANSPTGRSLYSVPVTLAFVFVYNMATATPVAGGLKKAIHTKGAIIAACIAGVAAAVVTSVYTY